MAKFAIKRLVGEMNQEDVDAAALRSLWCLADYPGLSWIHSTWDRERGEINCLYEALNEAQVRDHARASLLPCDEVREVEFIDPNEYLHG